jgi:hypothetical protein
VDRPGLRAEPAQRPHEQNHKGRKHHATSQYLLREKRLDARSKAAGDAASGTHVQPIRRSRAGRTGVHRIEPGERKAPRRLPHPSAAGCAGPARAPAGDLCGDTVPRTPGCPDGVTSEGKVIQEQHDSHRPGDLAAS